ncbi:MAG: replicative DNA helicase [Ruminococcus sp.]|nr:replicative DNA helicase [Ruminococcus sp.]
MRVNEILGKEMPNNVSAETAVLSCILVFPDSVSEALEKLEPEYFYNDINRAIFRAMMRLSGASKKIDAVSLQEELVTQGTFTTHEMARAHLNKLLDSFISRNNLSDHCNIIRDNYFVRALITASIDVLDLAGAGNVSAQELIDTAEQKIYNIRQGRMLQSLVPLETIIYEVYDRLQELSGPDADKKRGTRTGFSMLDKLTTGLNDTDLIILAARPAMGKSAFALNIAVNACKQNNKDTVIFSLEMSPEQVASRILASEALVNNTAMRTGMLSPDDWLKLAISAESLVKLPIYIDESAGMTVPAMKAKLRNMTNLGLVVIDYLQLMSSPNHHTNRVTEVSEITRQLKLMAKELRVPVLALSQLSREAEKRTDKRPMLSDLRESGSIEQDADIILFLYRDAYYDQNNAEADKSSAECIVAKNRHGSTDSVNLVWRGEYTLFSDPDTIHREH